MPPLLISIIVVLVAGLATPVFADDGLLEDYLPQTVNQAQLRGSANCLCRAPGRTFEVGQTGCLQTPEGPRLAECAMVLNNTSWRFTESPCPET
jgi:hypothetical protein